MHLNFFKKYRIRFSVIQNKIVDSVFCSLNTYSVIEFNVLARCENSASRPFVSYVNSLTDQWPPSYLASLFLSCLFSSFMASNSSFTASFSLSKNAARIAIWFSLIRRASRDRLAATLFFFRLFQYFSSLLSSGTNIYIGSWKSTYKTGTCIWSLYLKDNFLQFSINTCCGYSLESPRQCFYGDKWKMISGYPHYLCHSSWKEKNTKICFKWWCNYPIIWELCFYHTILIWATARQNQQTDCAPSEDSDQPGHPSAQYDQMNELGFIIPSTVFQSFRDDGRVNMKGSVQWSPVKVWEESPLQRDSNLRPLDPKSGVLTAWPRGRFRLISHRSVLNG